MQKSLSIFREIIIKPQGYEKLKISCPAIYGVLACDHGLSESGC